MKCTPRYFFSLLAVCASAASLAQEPVYEAMPRRQVFVRVGYDLSRLALPHVRNNGSRGFELSVDGELAYNFFPTVEVGQQSLKRSSDSLRYSMSGDYFRVGLDYNVIKYKHRLDRDIFFLGVRLGATRFSHAARRSLTFRATWQSSAWGMTSSHADIFSPTFPALPWTTRNLAGSRPKSCCG